MNPSDQDDYVTLYQGDGREMGPTLGRFDLLLTDPPYGINKADWDGEYPEWLATLALSAAESVAIMPGLWALPQCIAGLRDAYKWVLSGYNRNGMTHGAIGFNNWIPCVVAGRVKHGGQDAMSFTVGLQDKPKHPSPKPLPFMLWLIERLTEVDATILDPFAGSGTTGRAAKDLQRKCTMIEREEKYCEIAANRCRQEVLPFG